MSKTPPWRRALPAPGAGEGNLRVYAKQDIGGEMVNEVVLDFCDLPSGAITDVVAVIVKMAREAAPAIHILHSGRALCGLPGVPAEWPKYNKWVSRAQSGDATCAGCLGNLEELEKRLTSERGIK